MRKALIVGIDYYEKIGSLHGCVNDALAVEGVLEEHANGDMNFITPNVLTATSKEDAVTKRALKDEVRNLFECDEEIALFYFAGHGYAEDTGGVRLCQ
jgi:Caspase domain